MEKNISVIEISDTEIRLAVGYEKDGKVNLIHVAERSINGLMSGGEIIDFQTLSSIVASMREFKDETTKEKITINEATLLLPALGLNVFQSTKTTNVVSPYSLIAQIDIENAIALVEKENIPSGSKIIDIIPDAFILEKGRTFANPPINEKSKDVTVKAKIHTLPTNTVGDYKRVLEGARIGTRKMCVTPYALAELGKADKTIPASYILLDIGAEVTNVSLIGNGSVYQTVSFQCGSTALINQVSEKFQLSFDDALELLKRYGLDERKINFRPSIATAMINGISIEHDPQSLNFIIREFFKEEFFPKFDIAFETLMRGYPDNVKNLPVVFTGGLSEMFGFEVIAKEKFATNASIHKLAPKCIGARSSRWSAIVGAIYASSKYKGALSDTRVRNTELSRDKVQEQK